MLDSCEIRGFVPNFNRYLPLSGGGMRARPMGAGSSARVVAADVSVSIPSIGLMNAK